MASLPGRRRVPRGFVLLVAFSLGWRWRTGARLPLWKLGLALLGLLVVGTIGFAVAWPQQLGASSGLQSSVGWSDGR